MFSTQLKCHWLNQSTLRKLICRVTFSKQDLVMSNIMKENEEKNKKVPSTALGGTSLGQPHTASSLQRVLRETMHLTTLNNERKQRN